MLKRRRTVTLLKVFFGANDESFNNKLNVEWSRDLLDDLEIIRNQLLMGSISERGLHRLQEKLNNIPLESEDKKLKDIVDEITTRAAVELAKLERFKNK